MGNTISLAFLGLFDLRFSKGTPIGPLPFPFVLNILIKSISKDKTCSSNLFHACYMDDGVLAAGSESSPGLWSSSRPSCQLI